MRIEVRVRVRARIVKASPLASAAVVFVALMVARQPVSHRQPAAASSYGVVRPQKPSVSLPSVTGRAAPTVSPTRSRPASKAGASCHLLTAHGTPAVAVTATNPTAHRTNLHVSVNLRGPDDEFLDNVVVVLRHLGPHARGQDTERGRMAATCQVVAVSDF